jgi:hypothetical protein
LDLCLKPCKRALLSALHATSPCRGQAQLPLAPSHWPNPLPSQLLQESAAKIAPLLNVLQFIQIIVNVTQPAVQLKARVIAVHASSTEHQRCCRLLVWACNRLLSQPVTAAAVLGLPCMTHAAAACSSG